MSKRKRKRKLAVAALTGTIYDAVMDREAPDIMTGDREDRTHECIVAVAEHMKHHADDESESTGEYVYRWPGIGCLIWQSEKGDTNAQED